ncbi:unnamed protein product [Choristocarpus tenellus]
MRRIRDGGGGNASPESVATDEYVGRPPSPCPNEDDSTPREQWARLEPISRVSTDGDADRAPRRLAGLGMTGGQPNSQPQSPLNHVDLALDLNALIPLGEGPMCAKHPREPAAPRGNKQQSSRLMPPPVAKPSSSPPGEVVVRLPDVRGQKATLAPWSCSTQSDVGNVSPKDPLASPGYTREQGKVRRGRWKKGKRIGSGTCGNVYLGMNEDTGELMAVKEITLEVQERQLRGLYMEIQVMHRLVHPHIVGYLGAELQDSQRTLCIFQEWVPAGSLHSLLEQFGALGESTTRLYMRQLLQGLVYLHENRVIHRDIKAKNILVDDRGNVKLADFGCALLLQEDDQGGEGVEMSMKGTPLYMAPEILLKRKCGRRVDVWSLGCAVMEMATTEPPWSTAFQHPYEMIAQFVENPGPPPLPQHLPQGLLEFLSLCFTWEAELRPSARELLAHPYVQGTAPYRFVPAPIIPGGDDEMPLEHMDQHSAVQLMRRCSSATFDSLATQARQTALGAGGIAPPLASAGAAIPSSLFKPLSPRRSGAASMTSSVKRTPTRRRTCAAPMRSGIASEGAPGSSVGEELGSVAERQRRRTMPSPGTSPGLISVSPVPSHDSPLKTREVGQEGRDSEGVQSHLNKCAEELFSGDDDSPPPMVRPLEYRQHPKKRSDWSSGAMDR